MPAVIEVMFFRLEADEIKPADILREFFEAVTFEEERYTTLEIFKDLNMDPNVDGEYILEAKLRLWDDNPQLRRSMSVVQSSRDELERVLPKTFECPDPKLKQEFNQVYEELSNTERAGCEKLYESLFWSLENTLTLAVSSLNGYRVLEKKEDRKLLLEHCAGASKFHICLFKANSLTDDPSSEDMIWA